MPRMGVVWLVRKLSKSFIALRYAAAKQRVHQGQDIHMSHTKIFEHNIPRVVGHVLFL